MNSDHDDQRGPIILKATYYLTWLALAGLALGIAGLFHPDVSSTASMFFGASLILGVVVVVARAFYWFARGQ